MHMIVNIAGRDYQVEVTYKRMKSLIILRVKEDGVLRVSCRPGVSEAYIASFLQSKAKWIQKTTNTQKRHEMMNREGVQGPIVYWLGEKKYVRYEPSSRNYLFIDGDILTFYLKSMDQKTIETTFRKHASKVLMNMVNGLREEWDIKVCEANGLPLPTIGIRYMTSRWGVCYTSRSKIMLSTRLIHYPSVCLEAILLHEYTHFLVPNHSKRFYQAILKHMPQYYEYEAILKRM